MENSKTLPIVEDGAEDGNGGASLVVGSTDLYVDGKLRLIPVRVGRGDGSMPMSVANVQPDTYSGSERSGYSEEELCEYRLTSARSAEPSKLEEMGGHRRPLLLHSAGHMQQGHQ